MDQIFQRTEPLNHFDCSGRSVGLTGLIGKKDDIRGCAQRYILNANASQECADLIREAPRMFEPDDSFLRVSPSDMWLEFFAERDEEARPKRVGALVSADRSGRRGSIQGFFETTSGEPAMDHAEIIFDLDREVAERNAGFGIHQADLPHLNPLLDHARLEIRRECLRLIDGASAPVRQEFFQQIARGCWLLLPMILSFSVMLNSSGILKERASDLFRLNRARAKGERPPLLDHVEVSMSPEFTRFRSETGRNVDATTSPRLHYVRGHLVRRSGKTFWRSSHLRGHSDGQPIPRTVKFGSGSSA